jgi:hypothetical protein
VRLCAGARSLFGRRRLVLLARAGGTALLAGVVVGVVRWLAGGGLEDDGAAGVITTVYFAWRLALEPSGAPVHVAAWKASKTDAINPSRRSNERSGASVGPLG